MRFFINGPLSPLICQCLLENGTLDLKSAFDQANNLDLAQKNTETYSIPKATAAAFPASVAEQTSKALVLDDKVFLAGTICIKEMLFLWQCYP